MKLHKHLVESALKLVDEVVFNNKASMPTLQAAFKAHPKWGSKDRRLVGQIFFDLVRNYYRYEGLNPWHTFKNYWATTQEPIPDWDELKDFKVEAPHVDPHRQLSISTQLFERGTKELGNEFIHLIEGLNRPTKLYFRINTLKISANELLPKLEHEGLKVENDGNSYHFADRQNFATSGCFEEGYFEIQDSGSQKIAPFTHAKPGMLVLDACAGAGGKSLHLAAIMKNMGSIVSTDPNKKKLLELRKRATRAGASIVHPKDADELLPNQYDVVLLDVPCSGLGTIRREPERKYQLNNQKIDELIKIQKDILERYCHEVKIGGHLVYATCSILPSENQLQISQFLKNHPEFLLEEEQTHTPPQYDHDGFYMARMIRKTP